MFVNQRKGIFLKTTIFLLLLSAAGYAQQFRLKIQTVNELGSPVQANVVIGSKAMETDAAGQVQFTLFKGEHTIRISGVNYYPYSQNISLVRDTLLFVALSQVQHTLRLVEVTSSKNITLNQMGTHRLSIEQIKQLPVIFGEVDPLKTITFFPGIKNSGEGGAGIYVRGGGPDQNLVLLDGIQVYNPNHLLGFFSVFNGDAINNVEVIKGGMPAEYGGRLSSVIAINTKAGDKDTLRASGGIGLISSRLSLEGPLVKGKSSFAISARRTYIDQVAKLIARDTIGNNGYYFYDINARADYVINARNTLDLTFYTGRDKFVFVNDDQPGRSSEFSATWGNTILGLSWKQQVNSRWKHQLMLVTSNFNLNTGVRFSTQSIMFSSGLTDYQLKDDWVYIPNDRVKIKAGVQYIKHTFRPGAGSSTSSQLGFLSGIQDQHAREAAAYVSGEWDVTPKVNVVAGLRYSYFNQVGPTERTIYAADGTPTGEKEVFKKGESIAEYQYPEPRLNVLYKLDQASSIKGSYTRTVQYLHLATTSAASFPSDLWVPSSRLIRPGIADQLALGYFKNLPGNQYELSAEAYYKTMNNQIEFKPGAQLLLNQNIEGEMTFGTGKAYGLEVLLQKKTGRLTGWIGYTLSRAERTYPDMNNGKAFPYRYDRTHDVSVVTSYKINKKWTFSGVFVYGTGNALTLPNRRFTYNLGFNYENFNPYWTNINQYGKVNDYRMPAYHRVDLSFTYTPKPDSQRRFKSSWAFGLYNLYNRHNPYFIYLEVDEDAQRIRAKQVSLFPVMPSVTWNFKF